MCNLHNEQHPTTWSSYVLRMRDVQEADLQHVHRHRGDDLPEKHPVHPEWVADLLNRMLHDEAVWHDLPHLMETVLQIQSFVR